MDGDAISVLRPVAGGDELDDSASTVVPEPELQPPQLPRRLRVLELFAGIGGWRLALRAALPPGFEADVSAYDSGPHCSEVYERFFGEPCCRRNIEQLDRASLEGFDLWVMSPPCQPFSTTREAKQRDLGDRRCKALEHLCAVLPQLQRPPTWIALENVKGFHGSDACARWRAALEEAGLHCRELLLDLCNFGVPNHRTRYYLLAERSPRFARRRRAAAAPEAAGLDAGRTPSSPSTCRPAEDSTGDTPGELLPPGVVVRGPWAAMRRTEVDAAHKDARLAGSREAREEIFRRLRRLFCRELALLCEQAASGVCAAGDAPAVSEELAGTALWKLLPLPRSSADAVLVAFDADRDAAALLVRELGAEGATPGATWSWTEHTAAAPRPIGEFLEEDNLLPAEKEELLLPLSVLSKPFARGLSYVGPMDTQSFCFTGHYGKVLHKASGSLLHLPAVAPLDKTNPATAHGAVRFFSPKEIINLLGFPKDFSLPADMELKHRYKVVGNSIAVTVAGRLLRLLLLNEDDGQLALLEQAAPARGDAECGADLDEPLEEVLADADC